MYRLVLLVVALVGQAVFAAPPCRNTTLIRFKPRTDWGGTASYIHDETTSAELTLTEGVVLPPVVIEVRAEAGAAEDIGYDFEAEGLTLRLEAYPSLRFGGTTVLVRRGVAFFDSVVLQEPPKPSQRYSLRFSLPGRARNVLVSPNITYSPPSERRRPRALRFASAGFFTRARDSDDSREKAVPQGTTLPPFVLELSDQNGHPMTQGVAFSVTVTGATPVILSGTDRIVVASLSVDTPVQHSVEFTAALPAGFDAVPRLRSPLLTGVPAGLGLLQFHPTSSAIRQDNQGATAVLGVPLPPVVLRLHDQGMSVDTGATGLVVRATCAEAPLRGAEALVLRGVATFSNLAFSGTTAPRAAVIVFQGVGHNETLYSGTMAVATNAIKAMALTFTADSTVQEFTPAVLPATGTASMRDFVIPRVSIEVKDSALLADPSATDITLALRADGANLTDAPTATVRGGYAVFTEVRGTAPQAAFILRVLDPLNSDRAVQSATNTLQLGGPGLAPLLTQCQAVPGSCPLRLSFAREFAALSSHVYADDQAVFTTAGAVIPNVVVRLGNASGPFGDDVAADPAALPRVTAYTAASPAGELLLATAAGENRCVWRGLDCVFTCLRFREVPASLVRIRFIAQEPTAAAPPYEGIVSAATGRRLQTGFVTVAAAVTGSYDARFAVTAEQRWQSAFRYNGEPGSAVANVALPPVVVEVVDSLQVLDTAAAGIVFTAATSAGRLHVEGSTAPVVAGRAVFRGLRFAAVGDNPVLSFTAAQTQAPVAGRVLTTGRLTTTVLPVPDYSIAPQAEVTPTNNYTASFQPAAFDTVADVQVRITIVVVDSAGQRAMPRALGAVTLQAESREAELSGTTTATITPTTACACASFTTTVAAVRPGFAGGPLFVRYVVAAADMPHLLGQQVVVGPVTVRSASPATGGCSSTLAAPVVIGEFHVRHDAFAATKGAGVRDDLARLLSIEPSRVDLQVNTSRAVSRTNHSNLAPWSGTKASLSFVDPSAASTNRKTASELATEFLTLQPQCTARGIGLAAAYDTSDDNSCDPPAFLAALQNTRACVRTGKTPQCQCYSTVLLEKWGTACAKEPALGETIGTMCKELTTCREADIQNFCDGAFSAGATSLIWLYIASGFVFIGGVVTAAFFIHGVRRRPTKVKLSTAQDQDGLAAGLF